MTYFRQPLGIITQDAEDRRVLLVGLICTVLIFTAVSAYEGFGGSPVHRIAYVDLVQDTR